ncbi:MAG: S-methyl-5'-thioadenosine phosphorylase [Candidatus Omnitrophica bacterium]|nr:S-methyl-5'-thioadenosine phosphorylase [Candidatus Omnitrophota bacterium]
MKGRVGIIGGSGFYEMEGMKRLKKVKVTTPFGKPSDDFVTGVLEGKEVVFLARHGKGHSILPSEINYRANIWGMKKLGVDRIISISACGSLRKDIKPLDIVVPDQYVDRTNQARRMTFFGEGVVAHVTFADPVCGHLSKILYESGCSLGVSMHQAGTYINMEGPEFSTRAESELYRSWGMDIIAMSNMAEAKLAREAEICFATLACVTDYDCWYLEADTESVTVELIIQNLAKNVENAKNIVRHALRKIGEERPCACGTALKNAIITNPKFIPAKTKKKLELLIGKYIK